jgi:nitrogen fixation/metabolism regulation signal transduction histidine kinase
MVAAVLKRLTSSVVPLLIFAAILLLSLFFMGEATENSRQFGRIYSLLLIFNGAGILVLLVLIGANLHHLTWNYRRGVLGSRLTLRMLVMFVVLSLMPVSVVYYFSLQFLHRGIDSWFDVRVEQALEDALEMGKASLDLRVKEWLRQSEREARNLVEVPASMSSLVLDDVRERLRAGEVALLTEKGRVIAVSNRDATVIVPNLPNETILLQLKQGHSYTALEPIKDVGMHVRVVVPMGSGTEVVEPRILQALFPIQERINELADSVSGAFTQYRELTYLRKPLTYSFTLTLTLVLLLSVLTAVWAAFFSARRLVAPIRDLAEGTRAVASGDYDKQLPESSKDELGFLVQSFNEMTRRIARSRDEAARSKQQVEDQRTYLEIVLGQLSSGVITVNDDLLLRTANRAAGQILDIHPRSWIGKPLADLARAEPHLKPFCDAVILQSGKDQKNWSEELQFNPASGRTVLMCRGAYLHAHRAKQRGYVVLFDDITTLIKAQRDAAWAEVARRLAHEIKNPLTPIQLSAERLQHKYAKVLPGEQGELLQRYTHTIIQQVESMKEMVNAFSEYARPPALQLQCVDLNQLVGEVVDMYSSEEHRLSKEVRLETGLPRVIADVGRLRQVLHNLLKNAVEATAENESPTLEVETRLLDHEGGFVVVLRVCDNGPGFSAELLASGIEPYVTTKPKGTGLGLAIVQKIIEEHNGTLKLSNTDSGAEVEVQLVMLEEKVQATNEKKDQES